MTNLRRTATSQAAPPDGTHPARAFCKLVGILAVIAFLIGGLSYLVSERDLEILKHALSLWTLIALVVIINLVSFGCFIAGVAAWQWVRRDLKAPRDDGLDE